MINVDLCIVEQYEGKYVDLGALFLPVISANRTRIFEIFVFGF